MKPVTRQKVNIVIDIIMFVVMVALAVIGFLIRYTLISGAERWERFGRNMDMTILGLDRHEWGFIHLILGISLAVLLVLHIVFHWTQIVCMVKRLFPKSRMRIAAMTALIVLSGVIILAPFFLSVEFGEPIRGQGEGFGRNISQASSELDRPSAPVQQDLHQETLKVQTERKHEHKDERTLNIRGYHTFGKLAGTHNVSPEDIKKRLNIPVSISNNERLGRIRRLYGFTMSEVEDCILALKDDAGN